MKRISAKGIIGTPIFIIALLPFFLSLALMWIAIYIRHRHKKANYMLGEFLEGISE